MADATKKPAVVAAGKSKFTLTAHPDASEWDPNSGEGGFVVIYDEDGDTVGLAISTNPFDDKEHERARLFVAAPELYDFVERFASIDVQNPRLTEAAKELLRIIDGGEA